MSLICHDSSKIKKVAEPTRRWHLNDIIWHFLCRGKLVWNETVSFPWDLETFLILYLEDEKNIASMYLVRTYNLISKCQLVRS